MIGPTSFVVSHRQCASNKVGVAQEWAIDQPVTCQVTWRALHDQCLSRLVRQADGWALLGDQVNGQDEQASKTYTNNKGCQVSATGQEHMPRTLVQGPSSTYVRSIESPAAAASTGHVLARLQAAQ